MRVGNIAGEETRRGEELAVGPSHRDVLRGYGFRVKGRHYNTSLRHPRTVMAQYLASSTGA